VHRSGGGAIFKEMHEVIAEIPGELICLNILLTLRDQAAYGQVLNRNRNNNIKGIVSGD
jgi:hypothetical protein